jgi:hypothetical protein
VDSAEKLSIRIAVNMLSKMSAALRNDAETETARRKETEREREKE